MNWRDKWAERRSRFGKIVNTESEANAMLFIRDRFSDDGQRCVFFHRIKQSVDLYAKDYVERFLEVAQPPQSPNGCW